MTLSEYLKSIKERCEAATEGPWDKNPIMDLRKGGLFMHGYAGNKSPLVRCEGQSPQSLYNYNFIAHARTDVEVLVEMAGLLVERFEDCCDCDEDEGHFCGDCDLRKELEALVPGAKDEVSDG